MDREFHHVKRCAWLLPCLVGLAACSTHSTYTFLGYIEGDSLEIAAPIAGTLQVLSVQKGETVAANAPLFVLEQEKEKAQKRETTEKLSGANAELKLAKVQYQRDKTIYTKKLGTKSKLDESLARLERAEAEVLALIALLDQSAWNLAQKQVQAPTNGEVRETYYLPGEWVGAGTPVISLLAPQHINIRFFVPESLLGKLRVGQKVSVQCDGCNKDLSGKINYIAPQAEFTPPVIYSRTERNKLVFRVEAKPDPKIASLLHPGQPVEVNVALDNSHG